MEAKGWWRNRGHKVPGRPVRFEYATDEPRSRLDRLPGEAAPVLSLEDSPEDPRDPVAVLTKVIKEQGERILELEARLSRQT